MNYFFLFLQSNALELPVSLLFLYRTLKPSAKWSFTGALAFVTCLNAVTHPIVFFFIMNLKMTYLFNILVAETFAILSEALCYRQMSGEKAGYCLLISLFANFLSWQISPMITYALN